MNNKPLYIWWITTLLAMTGIFWAGYSGILSEVWLKDHTYLTSIIAFLFVYTTTYTGYLAYKIAKLEKIIRQKIVSRCFFLSEVAMGLAVLGASMAIILLLDVSLTTGDVANLSQVLISKWGELGPAFYPNFVGLAVSLFIKFQTYFIAEDYLDEE